MLNKDKKQPKADGEQTQTKAFEKNIKTLWIYTTLFCLFALALILISSFWQYKNDRRAEYYQDQYENVQTSSQSTIKNIQTENEALKNDIEKYKSEYEKLKKLFETEEALLNDAGAIIENADYLIKAQSYYSNYNYKSAREMLTAIDEAKLSPTMTEIYNKLKERLVK